MNPPPVIIPPIDRAYLVTILVEMLEIPSPTGRTDHVMQYLGERLEALDIPVAVTRRGAIQAVVPGRRRGPGRGVVVHADTIGCIVTALGENGRLSVRPVGTHSARFSEGAEVRVFTDDLSSVVTGTIVPLKASGHRFGDEVDSQGVGWEQVEVRVDARVEDAADLRRLGIEVGDHVALLSRPTVSPNGFIYARNLDDQAGVAAVLAALRALGDAGVAPAVETQLLVTCTEEIGTGASHGIHPDLAEIVGVDTAVVAPGQASREDRVCVAMGDGAGPFDYHLSRRLTRLAAAHGIPVVRDVFSHYRSDLAAAV
ncbi:MAG: osmoprotectant NAGGN system M42 family peptidase, partial [Miltoncostaeaceae bacterium]